MDIDFSELSREQREKLLQHVKEYKDNHIDEPEELEELERIRAEIEKGGFIGDDAYMLRVYIANTYTGENGEPYIQYLHSLNLPQLINFY